MSQKIRRREVVAQLEELKRAGLLDFSLSHANLDGPEPHLEVWSWPHALSVPVPSGVSDGARLLWEWMLTNRFLDIRGEAHGDAPQEWLRAFGGVKPFTEGDIVLVSGPPGEVAGEVLHAATPAEMPDLGPGSSSKEVKEIMREWKVDLLLLIRHQHEGQEVCFFALHHPGGWRDLRAQDLQITKVGNKT